MFFEIMIWYYKESPAYFLGRGFDIKRVWVGLFVDYFADHLFAVFQFLDLDDDTLISGRYVYTLHVVIVGTYHLQTGGNLSLIHI